MILICGNDQDVKRSILVVDEAATGDRDRELHTLNEKLISHLGNGNTESILNPYVMDVVLYPTRSKRNDQSQSVASFECLSLSREACA